MTCSICLESLIHTDHFCAIKSNLCHMGEYTQTTICNHKFHISCLFRWLLEHHTCPLCRSFVYISIYDVKCIHNMYAILYAIRYYGSEIWLNESRRRRKIENMKEAKKKIRDKKIKLKIRHKRLLSLRSSNKRPRRI